MYLDASVTMPLGMILIHLCPFLILTTYSLKLRLNAAFLPPLQS
jgi:hypothetical protein